MQRDLYRACKECGITSITISQRLALEEFHTHELALGDANGDAGWRMRPLPQPDAATTAAAET